MYFKPDIESMTAYVPGEQPGQDRPVIKLNTNENPYPPSPRVMQAVQAVQAEQLRVYPDPSARRFCQAAGQLLDVPPEWIIPGNGSDNLIVMTARACRSPMAIPTPTFPYYQTQAEVAGAELISVPCQGDDLSLPVEGLIRASAAVTFVANPNSPTGVAATNDDLRRLARGVDGLVVIDEAYVDFARHSALSVLADCENVILLRTLSKGYSLAGLRFGFAVGRPDVLAGLWKTKEIYNVGAITQAAALAAIEDQEWKNANADKVRASRQTLRDALAERGWRIWPSETNFLLGRPPQGNASSIHDALKRRDILVRYIPQPSLEDKLRITVGTDDQNQSLLAALDDA